MRNDGRLPLMNNHLDKGNNNGLRTKVAIDSFVEWIEKTGEKKDQLAFRADGRMLSFTYEVNPSLPNRKSQPTFY